MYRIAKVEVKAADDSNLNDPISMSGTFYQTRDLEYCYKSVRVGTSDAEATIDIGPVTTGYFISLMSDYPVKVRLNGASETQFVLMSNNVSATNVGGPLPMQCCFTMSGTVTSVRLTPISSAAQTANVKLFISGDPTNAYT